LIPNIKKETPPALAGDGISEGRILLGAGPGQVDRVAAHVVCQFHYTS
jgi:hypothetical protein